MRLQAFEIEEGSDPWTVLHHPARHVSKMLTLGQLAACLGPMISRSSAAKPG
jgi:hypothetical protein